MTREIARSEIIPNLLTVKLALSSTEQTLAERTKIRNAWVTEHPDEEHWDFLELFPWDKEGGSPDEVLRVYHRHFISSWGRVAIEIKEKLYLSKLSIAPSGYVVSSLWDDGSVKFRVHRAVATAFNYASNIDRELVVNHKDCDKTNNKHSNLEWTTQLENNQHARENGLIEVETGIDHFNSLAMVGEWRIPDEHFGMLFYTGSEHLLKHGFNLCSIYAACRGKNKDSYGCTWNYTDRKDLVTDLPEHLVEKMLGEKGQVVKYKPLKGTIIVTGETFYIRTSIDLKANGFATNHPYACAKGKLPLHKGCLWESVSLQETIGKPIGLTDTQFNFLHRKRSDE